MNNGPVPDAQASDEDLVRRVATRDPAALSVLYDRYARSVYTLATHLLGAAEAEEIVQDVFLRLWHKADRYDPARGRFSAWLMTVARNRVLDELRRRGVQYQARSAEAVDLILAGLVDPRANVEEAAWRHVQDESLYRALRDLPPDQRRVLVLAYFGGLSQSALADYLGWPLGTVKKRIRLGLRRLRAALGSLEDDFSERSAGQQAAAEPR